MPSRAATVTIAGVSALLALRPFGSTEKLADLVTLPSRAAAHLGLPATLMARLRAPEVSGADERQLGDEADLSARLERAVRDSAYPTDRDLLRDDVVPVAGEVDARLGRKRDTIKVRVADPDRVELGQLRPAAGRPPRTTERGDLSPRMNLHAARTRREQRGAAPIAFPATELTRPQHSDQSSSDVLSTRLNTSSFSRKMPVPRATAVSGSSATRAGTPR